MLLAILEILPEMSVEIIENLGLIQIVESNLPVMQILSSTGKMLYPKGI